MKDKKKKEKKEIRVENKKEEIEKRQVYVNQFLPATQGIGFETTELDFGGCWKS